MQCISCGKDIPDGSRYCPYCGSEQVKKCSKCGYKVEADWLFCPKCQADLKQQALLNRSASVCKEAIKKDNLKEAITGNSNRMLYVPGTGLFFVSLTFDGIYFLNENDRKVQKLTRNRNGAGTGCGNLTYYDGGVYFYRAGGAAKSSLVRYDIKLQELQKLKVKNEILSEAFQEFRGSMDYYLPSYHNGYHYYLSDNLNSLYRFSLKTLKSELVGPMPDIRTKQLPQNWEMIDISRIDEKSYGAYFCELYILDGVGYASLTGMHTAAIRFNLDNPSDFDFMPIDTCTTRRNDGGIIFPYNNKLIHSSANVLHSAGIYETTISNGNIGEMNTIVKGDLSSKNYSFIRRYSKGWWVQKNRLFMGRVFFNLETHKIITSPLITIDKENSRLFYVEDDKGGAYVLSESNLSYYPDKWWESHSDKSNYVIHNFK